MYFFVSKKFIFWSTRAFSSRKKARSLLTNAFWQIEQCILTDEQNVAENEFPFARGVGGPFLYLYP